MSTISAHWIAHAGLREAVRRFCEAEYPAERRGDPESPDLEAKRWQGMSDLGLPGLAISTRWGGSGLGAAEVMLATRELGRVLGGGAFISGAILAGGLLERAPYWIVDLVARYNLQLIRISKYCQGIETFDLRPRSAYHLEEPQFDEPEIYA